MLCCVDIQVTLVCEGLITSFDSAVVGLFPGMKSQVSLKIAFLVECRTASLIWANKVTNSVVLLHVHIKSLNLTIGSAAALNWAHMFSDVEMDLHMDIKSLLSDEALAASFMLANECFVAL